MDKKSKNLHQKLLEVKKSINYLQKDAEGYGYKYVSGAQVLDKVNAILNQEGVLLKTEVKEVHWEAVTLVSKDGTERTEFLYNVEMIMTWIDVDTADSIEVPWFGAGMNGQEQGFGSALTYAERYFMLKFFNIPTDNDDPDAFEKRHAGPKEADQSDLSQIDQLLETAEIDDKPRKKIEEALANGMTEEDAKKTIGWLVGNQLKNRLSTQKENIKQMDQKLALDDELDNRKK